MTSSAASASSSYHPFEHSSSSEGTIPEEESLQVQRSMSQIECLDKYRPIDSKTPIQFNALNQPVGENTNKFQSFLGKLARNNNLCPIYIAGWRNVDKSLKARLFDIVESKFSYTISRKVMQKVVLQSIGKKWREYKCRLRKKFDETKSKEENFQNKPPNVLQGQWERLVLYFMGKGKDLSVQGKKNRSLQKIQHTCGRRSYASIRKELEEKTGGEVGPADFFKVTHTHKSSKGLDEVASNIVEVVKRKVDDKIGGSSVSPSERFALEQVALAETLGPEHPGRVRGLGFCVTPSQFSCHDKLHRDSELQELKKKIEQMTEQMAKAEEKRAQVEEERDQKVKKLEEELAQMRQLFYAAQVEKLEEDLARTKQLLLASQSNLAQINSTRHA